MPLREGSRAPYDGKGDVGDGAWAPFRLLAFDHSAFIVALQPTLVLDETGNGVDALAGAQIAEHEGTRAAHAPGVSGSYVLGGALCTSAECRPREGSRAPYDGKRGGWRRSLGGVSI